jgi:excinuclease ABC subunit C
MRHPAADYRPDPRSIPDAPGCYLFRDGDGRVVYVGKAKSLRTRLSSYFQAASALAPRTRAMLAAARSVDWIVVDSEVEALHLELTLIQRHQPRYNVRYRDDKSYPYLVLTTSEQVPRARVQRGRVAPGDRRFGPYAHAYAIRETLDLLLRVFPVRTCSQGVYDRAARTGTPCLLHHIDRCAAPCTGEIDVDAHRALVDELARFLDGDTAGVLERLEREMREASEATEFEVAARRRDQLDAARRATEKQQMVADRDVDLDVIAVHEDDLEAAIQAFFVRRGRVVGRQGWTVDKVEPVSTEELLRTFLLRLYDERADDVPSTVLVPSLPDDVEALTRLLRERRRSSSGRARSQVRIHVPQRGDRRALLETVRQNAEEAFRRSRTRRASDFKTRSRALEGLQQALGLDEAPLRIECFDISHLSGTEVVGSMVVFEDGLPKRSDYRRFKLRRDANDDVAAMREVITRRFRRLHDDDGRFAYPPGLVIVDGGTGQLDAALEGLAAAGAPAIPVVALAKRLEELWRPGDARPVMLPRGSDALYLVQQLRDEAHRVAIGYQRRRRSRAVTTSALDAVPGIGPARRRALLERFGSLAAIRRASAEDLAEVPGVSRTLADAIVAALTDGEDGR